MASRFNTLYLGDPAEAAEKLDSNGDRETEEIDVNELRIALINALNRIAALERQVFSCE